MAAKKIALPTLGVEVQDCIPQEIPSHRGLFIGSLHSAFNKDILVQSGITHVLNIAGIPATFPESFIYLTVDIKDKEWSDLLLCLNVTNTFIDVGRKAGGILVHCSAGKSRSASLVIAYMMSSGKMSFQQALDALRAVRPYIAPNAGFVAQLQVYGGCSYALDDAQQEMMKRKLASLNEERRQSHGIKNPNEFRLHSGMPYSGLRLVMPESPTPVRVTVDRSRYVCSHCDIAILFCSLNILQHNKSPRPSSRSTSPIPDEIDYFPGDDAIMKSCNAYFYLEPLEWMSRSSNIRESSGTIGCYNCQKVIGQWDWNELICDCGAKIGPGAFRISANAVKEVPNTTPIVQPVLSRSVSLAVPNEGSAHGHRVSESLGGMTREQFRADVAAEASAYDHNHHQNNRHGHTIQAHGHSHGHSHAHGHGHTHGHSHGHHHHRDDSTANEDEAEIVGAWELEFFIKAPLFNAASSSLHPAFCSGTRSSADSPSSSKPPSVKHDRRKTFTFTF